MLDMQTHKEIARWSVPGKPAGVAIAKDAVFTVAPDSKTVRRHDPHSGDVIAKVQLDGGPIGVAFDTRRDRLFVSDWYNARIWVLNAETLKPLRDLIVGAAPAGLSLSNDGRYLASADRDADQVSIFDAATLELLHHVNVGTRPFGLNFTPDGRLFVGNVGSNDVSVVDPEKGLVTATVPVGNRPYGVAFAKNRAFVTNQYEDSVSVIDLNALVPLKRLETGEYPEGINATTDGNQIVVANWFENSVTIFDAEGLFMVNEITTCDGPRAFGTFLSGESK